MSFQTRIFRVLPYLTAITLTTNLLCATAAAETIYKSVDAEGNVTFSNTPPPAGVEAQQIELQPGPTAAQQQQSLKAEQNLEAQSNAIPEEESAPEEEQVQEESVVEPTTVYQQESDDSGDNEDPAYVDEGYVGDPNRDERLRDGVDDVREVTPLPTGAPRPAGRVR
jgi:hypothetical protein